VVFCKQARQLGRHKIWTVVNGLWVGNPSGQGSTSSPRNY
jgi:hypothetical protein